MATYRHKGIIARLARCQECRWAASSYNASLILEISKRHSEETGHRIEISTTTKGVVYN